MLSLSRRFLYERAYPSDHSACASAICNNFFKGTTQNFGIELTTSEQSQAGASIIGYSRQRLVDFMRYRSRKFAHSCESRNTRKLSLRVLDGSLGLLPFTDVADEAGKYPVSVLGQFSERNFHGELLAILAHANQFG